MTIVFTRLFFVVLSSIVGYYIGSLMGDFAMKAGLLGVGIGFFVALVVILVEWRMRSLSIRNLSASVFGLIFGFFMAWILMLVVRLVPMDDIIYSSLNIIFILD